MNLPEWSPELEQHLYSIYCDAVSEGEGIKAVYDRLRELSKGEHGSISLEIPNAVALPMPGLPGFSKVEIMRNPALKFSAVGLNFFARNEWIKEQ